LKRDFLFFDLGTETLRIFSAQKGLIFHGPSKISYNDDGDVVGYGSEVDESQLIEKQSVVYPVQKGAIANHHALLDLLKMIIKDAYKKSIASRVVPIFSVSPFSTNVEQRALMYVADSLEMGKVAFMPEYVFQLSSIFGKPEEKGLEFLVQTGIGRIDICLINDSRLIYGECIKGGFERLQKKIIRFLRADWDVEVGKKTLNTILCASENDRININGRSKITGEPMSVEVKRSYFQSIVKLEMAQLMASMKRVFEKIPPDLTAEFLEKGIRVSGGPVNEPWFLNAVKLESAFKVNISDTPGEDILNGFRRICEGNCENTVSEFAFLPWAVEVTR
jgi:rod shape-determining protein MreB